MEAILNIGQKQEVFWHHRSGWNYAIQSIMPLHSDDGIKFEGFLDHAIKRSPIEEPFVAFIHNPLYTPADYNSKYEQNSLHYVLNHNNWHKCKRLCRGIYVLSEKLRKDFLDMCDLPCNSLVHPVEMCETKFDFDMFLQQPTILHLGQWMRRFDSFKRVKFSGRKILFQIDERDILPDEIEVIKHVDNQTFDYVLSRVCVFSHFIDVVACNGVLDCIARDTPICCNRLPATEQYLGKDYPLFFEDLSEAADKLKDIALIQKASEHIRSLEKGIFSGQYFCDSVYRSRIYQNILKSKWIKTF